MMRPPVQKNALQQNDAHRLQHHKHLQQQQKQPDIIATTINDLQQTEAIVGKSKLEQRELLVENHLNSACFAQVHTHQQQQQQQPIIRPSLSTSAPRTIARKSLPDYYNNCCQQGNTRTHLPNSGNQNKRRESSAAIELLDLSTSPPTPYETVFSTQTTSAEVIQSRPTFTNNTNNSRFSFASQYSSRSSSSDDSSSSLSLTTGGCDSLLAAGESGAIVHTTSNNYNSYNNTFDDAAKNFIINFPADTSPQPAQQTLIGPSHTDYYLPLSETEPLLKNIEATVNNKERSIYLNKNSASLIFTRKDLSAAESQQTKATAATAAAATYQQQFELQSKTNNNLNGTTFTVSKTLPTFALATANHCGGATTTIRRQNHSTLRSFSEENYKRKPTKHLPATYHQQHRRSLQLNYNNNLVTTTTCGSIANNNHCCSGSGSSTSACSSTSNSAVLHKIHHNSHSYQQQQQIKQVQNKNCGSNLNSSTTTNNTAAATRKQYAYSWYAPIYSALEEELEQDSRDSSPLHNLANIKKKQHIQQYHQSQNSNSLRAPTDDNETEALIENRHKINIQSHSVADNLKRESLSKQLHPTKLVLPHTTRNSSGKRNHEVFKGIGHGGVSDIAAVEELSNHDLEGPHAGSLGLAGGPQPRRIRFGNFLKSLVGLRPSVSNRNISFGGASNSSIPANGSERESDTPPMAIPSSPEITITRTPSEQNMVVMRDPSSCREYNSFASREKLANLQRERVLKSGSTSSLNVMQQKLWNVMRREGSAISLHQEKSQSIVHYTGLRKCETVLALTRQTASPCSPTTNTKVGASNSRNHLSEDHAIRLSNTGSGIFSASGVEQIRPLNRLRNSISSTNNTCSRCSSLLSLAASSSRYSLSNSINPTAHTSNQHLRNSSNISNSNISRTFSRSREESIDAGLHFTVKRNSRTSALVSGSQRNSTSGANSNTSSRTPSMTSPTTTTASTIKLTTPPTDNFLSASMLSPFSNTLCITSTATAPASKENMKFPAKSLSTSLTVTSMLKVDGKKETTKINEHHQYDNENGDYDVIDGAYKNNGTNTSINTINKPCSTTSSSAASTLRPISQANVTFTETAEVVPTMTSIMQHCNSTNDSLTSTSSAALTLQPATRPFEMFTCKLCLIEVENSSHSTTLHQCGCQFCTECMKAYVEFEISEGAYEISCPDAQCPEQGVMTLPEIANLTTNNLMKKHYRYRLNREIELDKTRTWCPRAGCETVCLIGRTSAQSDAAPSTSASSAASTATAINPTTTTTTPNGTNAVTTLCAVQCPSCKDEFCSACKKTWHPNTTCEEHSRRLAADGQDDIGIPFDNDLIKCCPMCAVPIEKDEGCAQMMCKRCKHVFCWYCLASLDDDFLLRHYDKGPCKNKLGHSRASVVWHRAQVIGIFAGFGILLLVASPLLLLAAPCIICCKCRSCSGSKIDEADGEIDEATALQSLN